MWKEGGLIINTIIMECRMHTHACMHRGTTEPLHTKHAGEKAHSEKSIFGATCKKNKQKNKTKKQTCYTRQACSHNL